MFVSLRRTSSVQSKVKATINKSISTPSVMTASLTTRNHTSTHPNPSFTTSTTPTIITQHQPLSSLHTHQQRWMSFRDQFNKRVRANQDKFSKEFNDHQKALGQKAKGLQSAMNDAKTQKDVKHLKTLFPDGQITPYDPRAVAVRPDALQNVGEVALAKSVVQKDSFLSKMDKKFGGSLHIGRLNIWQGTLIISLIALFFYASRQYDKKTVQLPQKKLATPMIDFLRTSTLIKYMWTMRLMLEVGALVPFDGTENLADDALRDEIEQELTDASQQTVSNARADSHLMNKLKQHPDILRNQNYIKALALIDHELHTLDRELRDAVVALMEIYADLGRPYMDSYVNTINTANNVDALYLHNQLELSTETEPDYYLEKHELMKDALQVLFTRQNSSHRHFGQMFSDIYALTWLKSGIFALSDQDRALIPEELQYYIHTIGYDIVRIWQDNYVHQLHKKLSKHLHRLAFPSEIIDFGLVNDGRADAIEPFVRELRRINPKVIADYNDFLDYHQTISLTDNYKSWWRKMTSNMPRFRRAVDPQPTITISNYTQLYRDYERIFGKVPYLAMSSKEVLFLEKLKDISLGNLVDFDSAAHVIEEMSSTARLHKVKRLSDYSVEAVFDDASTKLKEMLDKDFNDKLSGMSYLDEKTEIKMIQEHEKNVESKTRAIKKHQHTLSLLKIPPTVYTNYLYNLLDISSPMLQVVKDHMDSLQQNDIFFPLYPCMGSYHGIYSDLTKSAQILCQRDSQLVDLKQQLGKIYRQLDGHGEELSEEMKQRFIDREKELLSVPDVREYALSMTRDEIARDDQFIYGKTAGLFDLDDDKSKLNVFGDREDDLNPNHPVNKGERGKIRYMISIPDPPKHLAHSIWMLDSYVDVRPGRPDHGEDRRAFSAKKFNALRSFMPIPTRYIPQSVKDAIKKQDQEETEKRRLELEKSKAKDFEKANKGVAKKYDKNGQEITEDLSLSQKQLKKHKHNLMFQQKDLYQNLSYDEIQTLERNKLERLHAISGANLAKLETCITQNLVELNSWGIDIKMPLQNLKPSQFKHLIQPPYSIIERETVSADKFAKMGGNTIPGQNTGLGAQPSSFKQATAPQSVTYLVISGKHRLLDKYNDDLAKTVHILGQKNQTVAPPASISISATPQQQNLSTKRDHTQLILGRQQPTEQDIMTTPKALTTPSTKDVKDSGLAPSQYYKQHSEEQHNLHVQALGDKKAGIDRHNIITNDQLINLKNITDQTQIVLPFSTLNDSNEVNFQQSLKHEFSQKDSSTALPTPQSKQDITPKDQNYGDEYTLEDKTTESLLLPSPIPSVDVEESQRIDHIQYAYKNVQSADTSDLSFHPASRVPQTTAKIELEKQQKQQALVLENLASARNSTQQLGNLNFDRIPVVSRKVSLQETKTPAEQTHNYQYEEIYDDDDDDGDDEYYEGNQPDLQDGQQSWSSWLWGSESKHQTNANLRKA